MKKLLLLAIVAVIAVGSGTFAYTFTTATTTVSVNATESDFAAVTAGTVAPPDVFGKFNGTWPAGTLFNVTPNADYTGDLIIKVYLVNAAAMSRYYSHNNMTLQFLDSANVTADEQGGFQLLNLDNATTEFTWANGTGTPPYHVQLTGGSYKLNSWKSLSGGSVQPQVWAEVIQR